ncbi:hypothetical protein Syun_023165 [Stephania yunnanensis]|uniref:Uncharacterized protein n=1 Tax=Stephania yunnanensis TaxID=152371 RepID=A0AAP0FN16_9MAGN
MYSPSLVVLPPPPSSSSSSSSYVSRLLHSRFLHPQISHLPNPLLNSSSSASPLSVLLHKRHLRNTSTRVSNGELQARSALEDGVVYRETLRLVECSMFAAVSGLLYFLSNSLAIENYFGCFFSLPIVISSLKWGIFAGRKTMVATALLLLTLSGPIKASTYLLMHGLVGFCMGSMWRLRTSWGLSIALCTFVRALGLLGYVLISSFLIRENILALITINIHASLTYLLTAIGVHTIPSMNTIYIIFGSLLLLNCLFFVFLLHILYAVFFARLGMKTSLTLPGWLEKAL